MSLPQVGMRTAIKIELGPHSARVMVKAIIGARNPLFQPPPS